jgi:hypothetical protein
VGRARWIFVPAPEQGPGAAHRATANLGEDSVLGVLPFLFGRSKIVELAGSFGVTPEVKIPVPAGPILADLDEILTPAQL